MKIKISDGTREVEVEADPDDGEGGLAEMEKVAVRLYELVAPKDNRDNAVGFTANGWALNSEIERRPEVSYNGFDVEGEE